MITSFTSGTPDYGPDYLDRSNNSNSTFETKGAEVPVSSLEEEEEDEAPPEQRRVSAPGNANAPLISTIKDASARLSRGAEPRKAIGFRT